MIAPHRSGRLAVVGLHPEDLRGKVTLSSAQAEPVDVILRVSRRGDVARLRADEERVCVAFLARGREVPLGREAGAGRVGDEVVLPEHIGRAEESETGDHIRWCKRGGGELPGGGDHLSRIFERETVGGQARGVEEFGVRSSGTIQQRQ